MEVKCPRSHSRSVGELLFDLLSQSLNATLFPLLQQLTFCMVFFSFQVISDAHSIVQILGAVQYGSLPTMEETEFPEYLYHLPRQCSSQV